MNGSSLQILSYLTHHAPQLIVAETLSAFKKRGKLDNDSNVDVLDVLVQLGLTSILDIYLVRRSRDACVGFATEPNLNFTGLE